MAVAASDNTAVFLFHRDLRLDDNTGLIEALRNHKTVIPVFIFPPEQIDPAKNKYFSNPAVQFMVESLIDLDGQLANYGSKLYMFRGDTVDVLHKIFVATKFAALYTNRDYSRYAVKRDAEIKKWCASSNINISYNDFEDYDLIPMSEGLNQSGKPYTVLSAYYKRYTASGTASLKVRQPVPFSKNVATNLIKVKNKNAKINNLGQGAAPLTRAAVCSYFSENPTIAVRGGRTLALEILRRAKRGDFAEYEKLRDYPALNATTRASAYLKFGCMSIREMYWAAAATGALIRELVFRSFYYKIYAQQPALQNGAAFHEAMDRAIPWHYDARKFDAWKTGRTGFPLADAGMRQLAGENWVHNRVRMLVANVATKYLLLDWRDCLRFFYQHLVDADIFSNTAGWQWGAGIGVDSAPYFRPPFNPFIQSKKFDKDAEYIKKWIPELSDVAAADIHKWNDAATRAKYPHCKYPAPIVDQKVASRTAVEIFKRAAATARGS